MNRKLLALAITAALAAPLAAQAAPTVYGQLNLSVDKLEAQTVGVDEWQVNSNASRLGVKGEEVLGNGYSAIYKVEYGVGADNGIASSNLWGLEAGGVPFPPFGVTVGESLTSRDIYLGLKANWGAVKLGNFDSPLKASQGTVDQFNDMVHLDLDSIGIRGDNRLTNSIGYESPKIANAVTVKVSLQPGESSFAAAGGDDGVADAISASVAYEAGGFYLALAVDEGSDNNAATTASDEDTIRVTAAYTLDALQLGVLLQTSELSNGTQKEGSGLVSAAYTAGKNVFKGQVIMTTEEDLVLGSDDQETLVFAVGMDHNFTGMTKVFGQLGLGQIDNFGGIQGADDNVTVVSLGMQTKF